MAKDISACFEITHAILHEPELRSFLHALCTFDGGRWRPERYNNSEPIKRPFSDDQTEEVIKLWMMGGIGIMFKRVTSPKFDIDFTGERPHNLVHDKFRMDVDTGYLRTAGSEDALLGLLSCLYDHLRPAYGYVAHYQDFLEKNRVVFKQGLATVERWVGRELGTCLPGTYWANWFGPQYAEFFGPEKLASAPCFRKEKMADGGYLILTSASPLNYPQPEAKEAERALAEHLGADAFFDIAEPDRPTTSPWPKAA